MNKTEFIAAVAEKAEISKKDSEKALKAFVDVVTEQLKAGDKVQWIYFDMVPEEHEVRTGAPEYTGRICVIGAELNEDKLAELFKLK